MTRKTNTRTVDPVMSSDELLLREGEKIVHALGAMFAPACEVVLHDLRSPGGEILAIANPLSGRTVGEPTTEMGLARIRDRNFPDVVQNYPNQLPDGRRAKSTSIGLRNADGECIAALCLNLDVSLFETVQKVIEQLASVNPEGSPVRESFKSGAEDHVHAAVLEFAARLNTQPKALTLVQRRQLMKELSDRGLLRMRGAPGQLADMLGVARSSIYHALNNSE